MTEERRLVTILFADVAGSTALGEVLDPEVLRALLARYYAIATEVTASHGGTIEKFIGDAVMAVFGLPAAHGDDAERALAAALELRDRVRSDARLGERLPIRLGVASGEVVAARDAKAGGDFLVTGDAVNVAARLQQAAAPWTILVAERTALATHAYRFGQLSLTEAKGKAVPVRSLLLIGRMARPRNRLPMIGRDAELLWLERIARRAFDERRTLIATVVAPPGTGKTRLLEALLERLPDMTARVVIATAQCLPYGERLTYGPLRGVLEGLAGIPEEASPEHLRKNTEAWLASREVADPVNVARALLATFGIGELEAPDPAVIFRAWRIAVEAAAAGAPLVLVLEDLHWSSNSLLDLLESVLQSSNGVPMLALVLTRPELLDRRSAWRGAMRNSQSITLAPLPATHVAALVTLLAENAPPPVVDAIVERAGGNPFYACEIVRVLRAQLEGRFEANAVRVALRSLPDTVQATVLARLDRLDAQERRLLQLGSVFGRTFSTRAVAALDPALAGVADSCTREMVGQDLIRPAGQREYAFDHILIREVAYGTLSRTERAGLHASAADWLEVSAGRLEEANAELIAVHAGEAAALATSLGLDSAEMFRRAATIRLGAAATATTAAAANHESLRHLRAALEFASPDDHLDLYERIGDTTVDGDTSVAAYQTALELARGGGAPASRILRIITSLIMFETRWSGSVAREQSTASMMALMDEGRRLAAVVDDETLRARFLAAEPFVLLQHANRGLEVTAAHLDQANLCAQEVVTLAQARNDNSLLSVALDGLAVIAIQRGDWKAVSTISRRRYGLGAQLSLAERLDAANMIAWAAAIQGDLSEADAVTAREIRSIQPGQAANWMLNIVGWRALTRMLAGDWDAALAAADRGRALWTELGGIAAGYAVRGFLAALDIARARNDFPAVACWSEVLDRIARQFDDSARVRAWKAYYHGDAEALRQMLRDPDAVSAHGVIILERYLSFLSDRSIPFAGEPLGAIASAADGQGARLLGGQVARCRGLASGNPDQLRGALATFEMLGALPAAARLHLELGTLTKDLAEVAAGETILRQLGDVEQLARVRRAT